MSEIDNCPHCNADLNGDPIPEELRKHYGDATHWRREVGLEYTNKYDGVWDWQCPYCSGIWPSEANKLTQAEKRKT